MTKKSKVKVISFRQRLREQSAERLLKMEQTIRILVVESIKPVSEINPYDVMRLALGGQTKTLRGRLITELSNEVMAELERLYYNNQQKLPLDEEKSDAD